MQSAEIAQRGPGIVRPAAPGAGARLAARHSLIVLPPLAMAWVLVVGWRKDAVAFDFTHAYLPAARAVIAGLSPYPPPTFEALAPKEAFVYPPLTAYLVAPFTLLPAAVAAAVASVLAVACVLAALRVMGVRDWRCYSVVLLWLPTYSAVQTANVTAVAVLGLALLWRYRETKTAPVVVGFLVAAKLFFWPLLLWLVVTRRYRAAVVGLTVSVVLIVGPWAGIGFAGMRDFPQLLNMLSSVQRLDQYTVGALLAFVIAWGAAHAIGLAFGAAVLAVGLIVGRTDERRSFALVIAAMLSLSPVVHIHYFVLLLVLVALFAPRMGWLWALPLLFWLSPQATNGAPWQTALALAVAAATVALSVRRGPRTEQRWLLGRHRSEALTPMVHAGRASG
jgi:alpha-1,2-mannosyltransferase